MKQRIKQYAVALYDAGHDAAEKDIPLIVERFVRILAHDGMLRSVRQIITQFEEYWNAHEHIADVSVTTARALPAALEKTMAATFAKALHLKQCVVRTTTDPALIGGAVVQYGDMRIDGSIRTRLQQLKHTMKK